MMNSNVLFRSHLMQQFATVARSQSRPPIALSVGRKRDAALGGKQDLTALPAAPLLQFQPSQRFDRRNFSSSIETSTSIMHEDEEKDTMELVLQQVDSSELEDSHRDFDASAGPPDGNLSSTASSFQSLISSRRTISCYLQLNQDLKPALDRAIVCAQSAPNHKRTEPFTFKRLLSQSVIRELSEIAYHVTFERRFLKDPEGAKHFAERKKIKWAAQVPAYLVALVGNQPDQESPASDDEDFDDGPYQELPFIPPVTERQLEDYASSCAAVQNILLSLHAEHIGTKWVTGPVIKTRAFRELVGAKTTDRVVAMIMVGYPGGGRTPPRGPMRRRATEDIVQDL